MAGEPHQPTHGAGERRGIPRSLVILLDHSLPDTKQEYVPMMSSLMQDMSDIFGLLLVYALPLACGFAVTSKTEESTFDVNDLLNR
jgi:hypothetical protein